MDSRVFGRQGKMIERQMLKLHVFVDANSYFDWKAKIASVPIESIKITT